MNDQQDDDGVTPQAPKVFVRNRAGVEVEAYGRNHPTAERIAKGDVVEGEHLIASHRSKGRAVAVERVAGFRGQEPIDRYASRGLIGKDEYMAGMMLRTDWHACRLAGRVTARYAEPTAAGIGDNPVDVQADARQRYVRAMTAVGPMLAPVVVHVVCMGGSAGDWAAIHGARGKRAETRGIDTLSLALGALAIFYGLRSPPAVVLPDSTPAAEPPSLREVLGQAPEMWVWVPAVGLTGRPILSIGERGAKS